MKRTLLTALIVVCLPLMAIGQETDWKVLSRYEKAPVKKQLASRLTDYAKINTQSQPTGKVPSTPGQLKLAKQLAKELKKNGAVQVKVDKSGIVTAQVPGNAANYPTVAFFAHLDTTPSVSAQNVQPQTHTYKGGEIVIHADKKLVLNTYNAPQLLRANGHEIITASGDTLLGADDKAGAAILLTAVQYLYDHSQLPHGTLYFVFTPDSYSGKGIAQLDAAQIPADYVYTLDAGELGQLVSETFSGKQFKAVFEGDRTPQLSTAIHSPFADNVLMASDFHTLLPRHKRPETTANKNGFIYVDNISTQGNRSEVTGIIRAFSEAELQTLTQEVTQAFNTVKSMNYKGKNFALTFVSQDTNVKNALPEKTLTRAQTAMKAEEVTPILSAARQTTDAARLAAKGLPAAGLFTGYYHPGTLLEYADVDVMEASFRTVLRLITSPTK